MAHTAPSRPAVSPPFSLDEGANTSSAAALPLGPVGWSPYKRADVADHLLALSVTGNWPRLREHSRLLQHCGTQRHYTLYPGEVYRAENTWWCHSRACPSCQRRLADRRRRQVLAWSQVNQHALARYHQYHLVLTLPQRGKPVQTTKYLTERFTQLRGGN